MADLEVFKEYLEPHWAAFDTFFHHALQNDIVLISDVNQYLLRHAGKQLRPLLVLLSAKMHGDITESVYLAASAVEMVHTSSLLHDDVIDNADQRRGALSVKALWKSNVAVLTGDYWMAYIFHLVITHHEERLLPWFSRCLVDLSEGELLQMEKTQSLNITEKDYFTIIGKKTASLLAVSMASGAITANAGDETVQKMYDAGYHIGLAFQIRDDMLDYCKTNILGKPAGNDLREQKLTLPLIYSLSQTDKHTRKQILRWVKSSMHTTQYYRKIIHFVKEYKGMEYADTILRQHTAKAVEILQSFPSGEASYRLIELAHHLTTRRK